MDRGPAIVSVLRLVMDACEAQSALAVLGNHDYKLYRKLKGNEVIVRHGLAESLAQLEPCPDLFLQRTKQFLGRLPCHYILANAGLIVAHAGLKEKYHGVDSKSACFFALYGETTGEIDQYGYPIRADWAANYRGDAVVVYGHTPLVDTAWMNNTLCVDLGCVFGGRLAALRYPERDIVSVAAHQEYCPHRHFEA